MTNDSLLVVLIASGVAYGTPLLYAALGELLAERSGVLNLGVEGMMLVGAVMGFWTVQRLHANTGLSLAASIGVAALAGAAMAAIHAFLVITLRASQDGDFRHTLDADPNGLQKQYYGYAGIVVAALGRYNPFAVLVVAFLIGGLQNAGNVLQSADFPSGLVGVMQGIILFCALGGELLVRYRVRFGRRAPEAAPAPEAA